MKAKICLIIVGFILTFGTTGVTYAERFVTINGYRQNNLQIHNMEIQIGGKIPNGNYWLNEYGDWGYAGNPNTMGNIYRNQNETNDGQEERKSLSERGLLNSPWDNWGVAVYPN